MSSIRPARTPLRELNDGLFPMASAGKSGVVRFGKPEFRSQTPIRPLDFSGLSGPEPLNATSNVAGAQDKSSAGPLPDATQNILFQTPTSALKTNYEMLDQSLGSGFKFYDSAFKTPAGPGFDMEPRISDITMSGGGTSILRRKRPRRLFDTPVNKENILEMESLEPEILEHAQQRL